MELRPEGRRESLHGGARMAWLAGAIVALAGGAALILGVEFRSWRLASRAIVLSLFRWHDIATVVQSFLLPPFAVEISRLTSPTHRAGISGIVGASAILAVGLLTLLQLLGVLRFGPDTWYMLPQGIVGLWIIAMSRRLRASSRALNWLGHVAGAGLVLIAASLLTVIFYFGPSALSGTIQDRSSNAQIVNQVSHVTLRIGTYLGLLGVPPWAVLIARRFR